MCQGTDSIYRFIDLSESFLKDGRYIDKSLFRDGFIILYSSVGLFDGRPNSACGSKETTAIGIRPNPRITHPTLP